MTESALNPLIKSFPIRAGGWVQNRSGDVAHIRAVYRDTANSDVLMDLWYYSCDGDKIGRVSPASGGPRTYEPAVTYDTWWQRIHPPKFPLKMRSQEDGSYSYMLPSIPDGEYLPRPPRVAGETHSLKDGADASQVADKLERSIVVKGLSGDAKTSIERRVTELRDIARRES